MSFGKVLFILLLGVCSLSLLQGAGRIRHLEDLALPVVERQEWRFTGFPILAWWPPPGTATARDFSLYKEAGFTIYAANPDTGFETSISLATEAGLPILALGSYQKLSLPKPQHPIQLAEEDSNIVGWITADEPSGTRRLVSTITTVNRLMREEADRVAFFNMLPPRRQGNPDTRTIIDVAMRCGMPILSYDDYVMLDNGRTETKEHFDALEVFRQASVEHDVPFWAFALTSGHERYRRPSESDLRWKQYTNLAYGAKGLWYFCYWGPRDRRNWDKISIVNPKNGGKTELYEYVKELNHAVLCMDDILLGLTSEGVVHTDPPEGHPAFAPDRYWISDIVAEDALVGFFRDGDGTAYAMVVNNLHGMDTSAEAAADTIELAFAPEVKSVVAVSWLDGTPGPIPMEERKASLRVHGGTGVLLRAEGVKSAS